MVEGRIRGLDGVRAIAVGLVVLNHSFYSKFHLLTGGSGVRLFFVLSGFLIISILHRRRIAIEQEGVPIRTEIRHFYENRLFRIWPIYYLALCFALATHQLRTGVAIDPPSWIANVLFLGNAMMAYVWFAWRQVGVFWSVAVEEQFYLWSGLLLLLVRSRRHAAICAAMFAIAVVAAAATDAVAGDPERAAFSIDVGSLTNFGHIALGGIAALALKPTKLIARLAAPALALYLLGTFTGFPSWMAGALFFTPALLIPVVLVGIAHDQGGLLTRLLDLPPVRYIGRISYGIYLYHTLVRLELLPLATWFDRHLTMKAVVETGLTIIVASASWRFIEKPLLDLRDRRRLRATELRAVRDAVAA